MLVLVGGYRVRRAVAQLIVRRERAVTPPTKH